MSYLTTSQLDTTATIITETGSVKVDSLDICPINDPNTQLYDFTVNEDNTYFANGLLVHNHIAPFCHVHIIPWPDDGDFFGGLTTITTLTAEHEDPGEEDPICIIPPGIDDPGAPVINRDPGTPPDLPPDPPAEEEEEEEEEEPDTYIEIKYTPPEIIKPEEISCDEECNKDNLTY